MRTFLVNETSENVWFDQFRIETTTPVILQETHYDPWGVELQGLGYQQAGIKANKYLYNGKEFNDHLGINLSDYGARLYDASIGRWFVVDPLAELAADWTPYRAFFNNPVSYTDPTGMFESRQEAREYKKENGIKGRIQKDGDGGFAINNKRNGESYSRNSFLAGQPHIGLQADGVTKSQLVSGTRDYSSSSSDINGQNQTSMSGWGGSYDFGYTGNVLNVGSEVYGQLGKSINNSKSWIDLKGNRRSTELLKRQPNGKYVRGVQGLRNSQAAAAKAASNYQIAGRIVGGLSMAVTIAQFGTGQISGTEATVDLIMGGIGFTGWGAPISLTYFGGKFLYEYSTGNTLFEKPNGN